MPFPTSLSAHFPRALVTRGRAALIGLGFLICSITHAQSSYYIENWSFGAVQQNGDWATYDEAAQAANAYLNAGELHPLWTYDSCAPVGVPTAAGTNGQCKAYYNGSLHGDYFFTAAGATPTYWLNASKPSRSQVKTNDCVCDPINPAVGNVYTTENDIAFAGGAGAIQFRRFYNSADASGTDNVPGWRHSYDRSIATVYQTPNTYPGQSITVSQAYADASSACTIGFGNVQAAVSAWAGATASYNSGACVLSKNSVTIGTIAINSFPARAPSSGPVEYDVIRDDGQILRYTLQNGIINSPSGVSVRLVITGSGFTVTDDNDNVETYNAAGVLQSVTSRSGQVQTVTYDGNGLLYQVIDSFGNSLIITRNEHGAISSVALNSGAPVNYGYDRSLRLSTVTYPDSNLKTYVYGDSRFTNALTSIVDEVATTFSTWAYDSQERAQSTQEAGGAGATTLAYNSDGSVTVTDALNAVRTFSYTRVGDIDRVAGISGSQCASCEESASTTYDNAGWVASRTDYNGNLTCYTNDPVRGLELVRVEGFAPGSTCPTNLAGYTPATGTTQRKIATTWSTNFRLPSSITESTRTIGFGYDSFGNLLTRTITDTTVTPNMSHTWTYTYDGYGHVHTAQEPRTDLNSTTTYTYYTCTTGSKCGQIQTVTDQLGHVTTFNTYNAYGQPLTITDPNGVLMTLTYDARQHLTSQSVGSETTTLGYYPTELLQKVTLADNS